MDRRDFLIKGAAMASWLLATALPRSAAAKKNLIEKSPNADLYRIDAYSRPYRPRKTYQKDGQERHRYEHPGSPSLG